MSRPRILRRLARFLRPLVRERVHNALNRAGVALDDEDAIDALGVRIAAEIEQRADFSAVPLIGAALEAADDVVIEALVQSALDEAVEHARQALAAARANAQHRAEYGV